MTDVSQQLKALALCQTEHPADAVSLLMQAAGEILYPSMGLAGSVQTLRGCIDDVEAVMTAVHGRAPDEPVQ